MHILFWSLSEVLIVLISLGAVAFVTLLERKYLGLSQNRLGPNKVTFVGLLQPLADGVKLLAKQFLKSGLSQSLLFMLSPLLLLMVFMTSWAVIIVWAGLNYGLKFSSLMFFSILGSSTYAVILTGWAIMSTFAKLGSLRGILQSLSYEVALILVFLIALVFLGGLSFSFSISANLEGLFMWAIGWFLLLMMETNRAPFDLLEGESELISGFNIEMGSLMFVFLFLSEYGMIIILSLVASLVVWGSVSVFMVLMSSLVLVARSCYPRVRYDSLMSTMWKMILPLALTAFYLILMF